jgi:hypothetical protein
MLGFTFSVGDITHAIYSWYWARQRKFSDTALNKLFSVVHKFNPIKLRK